MIQVKLLKDVDGMFKNHIYNVSEAVAKQLVDHGCFRRQDGTLHSGTGDVAIYYSKDRDELDGSLAPQIQIPQQLASCRILKISDEKAPFSSAWQVSNNTISNVEFMQYIYDHEKYGVLCGYDTNNEKFLVVLDFDNKETQDEVLALGLFPETFSVTTARKKLLHLYFYTEETKAWKIMTKDKDTLVDVQAMGKQVVGPGTRIPDGRMYEIVKDIPIATISLSLLHRILDRFDISKQQEALQQVSDGLTLDDFNKPKRDDKALQEIRSRLKIVDILHDAGISTSRNPTQCPFHSSKGGKCLGFDNSRGIWSCFHCLNKSQKVITINGVKEAQNIVEGDILINAYGERIKVYNTHHQKNDENILQIYTYVSNIPLEVSEEHGMFIIRDTSCHRRDSKISCNSVCSYLPENSKDQSRRCTKAHFSEYQLSEKVAAKNITIKDSLVYPIPTYSKNIQKILLPRKSSRRGTAQKIFELELTNELLWIIGLFIAEGSINKGRGIRFGLHHKEIAYATRVKTYFESIGQHVNIIDRTESLCKTIDISNQWIAQYFEKTFGHGQQERIIPRFLLDLHTNRLRHVIDGIFDGDGSKDKNGDLQYVIVQTSEQLAYNLFEAGLKLGYSPSIRAYMPKDRGDTQKPRRRIFTINYRIKQRTKGTFKLDNWYVMPITKIEEVPNTADFLVDISVEGVHKSFLTPEGIVGNCGEKGTAIDLWMKINRVDDFVDAKRQLCEKFNIKDTYIAEKIAAEQPINDLPMVRLPQDSYKITEFAEDLGQYFHGDETIFYKPDEENIVEIKEYEDKLLKRQIVGFKVVDPKRLLALIDERVNTYILRSVRDSEVEVVRSAKEQDIKLLSATNPFLNSLYKIKRFLTYPIPFINSSGELIIPKCDAGKGYYDERFQAYFTPDTPELVLMTVDEAKFLLYDMLGEFCFRDEIDRVMSIAYILTPMCRGLYGRPTARTPIFILSANRERAGKDYLAGLRGILYEGQAIDDTPIVTSDKSDSSNEELRKKFTSALKSGRRLFHSSNNRGFLNNAVLEQFSTSEIWRDRELGRNVQLELNNEVDISLSANVGLTYTPDLWFRSRPINLFYSEENPNERRYTRTDLHGYVSMYRAKLLSALYTLISTWYSAGSPVGPTPFTSFPEWARVIGGIMDFHRMGDPCIAIEDTNIGGDKETQSMKELFTFMGLYQLNDGNVPLGYKISDIRRIVVEAHSNEEMESFMSWDFSDKSAQTKFGTLIRRFVGREFHCKYQADKLKSHPTRFKEIFSKVKLVIAKNNDRSNQILYAFPMTFEDDKMRAELHRLGELSEGLVEEYIVSDTEAILRGLGNEGVYVDDLISKGITEEQVAELLNSGVLYQIKPGFVRVLK